jgi:hypothetical protein
LPTAEALAFMPSALPDFAESKVLVKFKCKNLIAEAVCGKG